MKITTRHILLSLSITTCLILSAMLGMSHHKQELRQAEAGHMLAQRVAVLEVEQYIKSRLPRQNVAERRGAAELIVDAATEFRLSPIMLARVAIAESALNHQAIGDGGRSLGVAQVQRFWVSHIPFVESERDLLRMDIGIRAGAWVLRHYADLCGEEAELMLACYNSGPNINEQSRKYAKRVMSGT